MLFGDEDITLHDNSLKSDNTNQKHQDSTPIKNDVFTPTNDILGHSDFCNKTLSALQKNILPSVILIHGSYGIGKMASANWIIHTFLSLLHSKDIDISSHPDVFVLQSQIPEGKQGFSLSFENYISVDDARKINEFSYKASGLSDKKFIIIDHIDGMSKQSSNALLKTLEDAPRGTYFFLISHNINKVLPTIKSRCVSFGLKPLDTQDFSKLNTGNSTDICKIANGSPGLANLLQQYKFDEIAKLTQICLDNPTQEALMELKNHDQDVMLIALENALCKHYSQSEDNKNVAELITFLFQGKDSPGNEYKIFDRLTQLSLMSRNNSLFKAFNTNKKLSAEYLTSFF